MAESRLKQLINRMFVAGSTSELDSQSKIADDEPLKRHDEELESEANRSFNNWAPSSCTLISPTSCPPISCKRPSAIYSVYHCPWNPYIAKLLWYLVLLLAILSLIEDFLGRRLQPTHDEIVCWIYTTIKGFLA